MRSGGEPVQRLRPQLWSQLLASLADRQSRPAAFRPSVNIGHLRLRAQIGARAWPIIVSVLTCLGLFVLLLRDMINTAPSSAVALGIALSVSPTFEVAYRRTTGRSYGELLQSSRPAPPTPPGK
jgi:hypothetical protein